MQNKFLLLIILLHFIKISNQNWWINAKGLQINSENYEQLIGKEKHVVIKFYTPWCFWCEKMSNEYDKLYEHYKDNKEILIARINCQDEDQLCHHFKVHGFPTIYYFQPNSNKKLNSFNKDSRKLEDFISWIQTNYKFVAAQSSTSSVLQIAQPSNNQSDVEAQLYEIYKQLIQIYEKQQYDFKLHENELILINNKIKPLNQQNHVIFKKKDKSYNFTHISISSILGIILAIFTCVLIENYKKYQWKNSKSN